MATQPLMIHTYRNHHLDSTRWEHYVPRDDDIIIVTSVKSGTTWVQTIVMYLIFGDVQPRPVWHTSPWLDARFGPPLDEILEVLRAQQHRRFIKTHLPLDGLPYHPQVKYIVVGRDARDVLMSLWNHCRNYTTEFYERLNDTGHVGDPFPGCPDDIREFWRGWITSGWFEWESEGYPFWSNLRHTQTWWDFRHLPNILFVHFNDLLRDLAGEIRLIADYLEIDAPRDLLAAIGDAVTFRSVKRRAEELLPDIERGFTGGAQTFIHKGTNGRWRSVLTDDDLKLYQAAAARELTPDCARWLENGRRIDA
jgi:aryl sulfotransferase